MPLYEYQCTRCHKRVEKIQSFSAEPLTVCEACGGALEKLISAPAIQFKGTGWYVTDYKKSGGATAESKPTDSKEAAAPAKDASSSDSSAKPAATSPAAAPAKASEK